jgi:UDP-2,3-diacylglucosamine hydrolase
VERSLGLMCGAGVLPARMAAAARRQGWRVVAFTFAEAPGVATHADVMIPSRFTETGPVLTAIRQHGISAALFSGTFWLGEVLRAETGDGTSLAITREAGTLAGTGLAAAVVSVLGGLGVDVLDPRAFVGDWLGGRGCWTARSPSDVEWADVRLGFGLARSCADSGIGQTVVVKRGVVVAVEAAEGTTAAIRRGGEVGGAGAVVVKAVATGHDYRFDTPVIGSETIGAAAASGVTVVAVEANRVLLVDRDTVLRLADASGIAIVGVDDGGSNR